MPSRDMTIDPWDLAILRYLALDPPAWVRRSATALRGVLEDYTGDLKLYLGRLPAPKPFARRVQRLREMYLLRYSPEEADGPSLWALTFAGETFVEMLNKEVRR